MRPTTSTMIPIVQRIGILAMNPIIRRARPRMIIEISCSADESRAMLHCSQEASLNVHPPVSCARTIVDHDPRIGAPSPDPAVWTVGPRVRKGTPREQINDQ